MNQEHTVINIDSDDIRNENEEVDPSSKKQSVNFEAIESSLRESPLQIDFRTEYDQEFAFIKTVIQMGFFNENILFYEDNKLKLFSRSTKGDDFMFNLMDPYNFYNVNDITRIYKEYLSIGPNYFQKFQIQNNKLIAVTNFYCRIYNIFDKETKFSYKHLKSLSENIQTLTQEKYEVSTKNSTLKTESEYEGSIKWIVNYINSVNPHLQFEAKSDAKLEAKSDAKEVYIYNIISYDFLRNEDLLLITEDGVYIYSLDMHGKIHEKFNSKFFIDKEKNIFLAELIYNRYVELYKQTSLTNLQLLEPIVYHLLDLNTFSPSTEAEENEKQSLNQISIYKYIKNLLKKRKSQSTINLTVPFPNICVYSEKYLFWKELLYKPEASLFIKME
ncbi:13088_t:CDS:2, partial [Racocetra fulgida]